MLLASGGHLPQVFPLLLYSCGPLSLSLVLKTMEPGLAIVWTLLLAPEYSLSESVFILLLLPLKLFLDPGLTNSFAGRMN